MLLNHFAQIILILIWSLFPAFASKAQNSPKPYLLHWTEKDGLSDNRVFALLKDQRGMLWIGTSNGLSRFDGKEFENFQYDPKDRTSVGANHVMRLMESKEGNIWVGTDGGGLSVYNYQKDHFVSLRQNLDYPDKGLPEDRIYNFLQEEDEVLIGYRAIGSGKGGLTAVSEDLKIKEHFLQDVKDYAGFRIKVTRSLKDSQEQNIYWLAGRSFFKWNRKTGEIKEFHHPSFSPNHTSISGIVEHSDSTLLVGLLYDGLWLFDKKNDKWLRKIHDQPVHSFLKDKSGKIWLADAKGVGWINPDNSSMSYEILTSGPNSPFKNHVSISHIFLIDDNLWMGTNKGLFCWIYKFKQFNTRSLKINEKEYAYYPEFLSASSRNEWIFIDRKRGLIFTDSLLQTKQTIVMPNQMGVRKAGLSKNKDFVLIGANKGLYKWARGDQQIQPLTLSHPFVDLKQVRAWTIYMDDFESAWVGTQTSGLIKINFRENKVVQFLHDPKDSLSLCHNNYLFEIDKDAKNNLWICTDKGVSIIDPLSEKFVHYPGLKKIQNYVVQCLEMDAQQNMWIGTRDQGLFKYHFPSQTLTNFSAIDGLLYNGVNEIALEDSILWLATQQGLCKMNLNTEKIVGFDQKKGLYSNMLYSSRLKRLPDGHMMLTYQDSEYFSLFKNENLKSHFHPPALVINSIRILSDKNNKSLITSGGSNVDLRPSENYFAIDFNAIHFFQPRGIEYQYKLESYDQDWIKAGKVNTAVYTNLPGGNYQFKVKAANADKVWSDVQQLNIFLATPWYETIIFYVLVGLCLLGLGFVFYKYRTNQIRKEANFKRQLAETEMRALRSQINPHFIFNCLNSIKGYIIDNRIEDGTEYVGRFAQLIRMILNHSKEKLIPISKEIEAVKLYTWLEQERLSHKFDVVFDFSFESSPETLKIPPLLFQSYIENAIWHGLMNLNDKGNLKIKIEELKDHLLIQIMDDGIGRAAAAALKNKSVFKKPSMGLELSAGRLDQINELYQIQSNITIEDQFTDRTHTGTVVKIIFPKIKTNIYAQSNHSR